MLLGKRQRPPMKRTTSMTEFTLDLNHTIVVDDDDNKSLHHPNTTTTTMINNNMTTTIKPPLSPTVTTSRIQRRNSADHNQIPHFLTACHLCKRRLINGHDIFMYRGDSAFCSLECRQQQMNQDEKCSMLPKTHNASTTSPNASGTVAAM